jgi:hypothetical protein
VLDKGGDFSTDAPKKLEARIKQDGSGITIESTFNEPENGTVPLLYLGVMTNKLHLSCDGRVEQNQIGPFQMASKSTLDGKQMETQWTAVVKDEQIQGHWTHTLSDDGRRMTLEIKESFKGGQNSQATLRFVRK